MARNNLINLSRLTMKFLIVLAIFLAAAIAEETKVAEVTDQQVEAARYGGYGGYGYRYGRSVDADTEGQEHYYGAYYGHPGYYGHGYRYGRSVAADTEGQESHYGGYYGRGYGHRYGRSVAADTDGQESYYGGYYGRGYGHRYGRSPMIPKDRKATTEDTTLVMAATITADIITTK